MSKVNKRLKEMRRVWSVGSVILTYMNSRGKEGWDCDTMLNTLADVYKRDDNVSRIIWCVMDAVC